MARTVGQGWCFSFWCSAGLIAGTAGLSGACITAGVPREPSKPIVEFPSARTLAEIESKPAAIIPDVATGEIPADGWAVAAMDVAMRWDEPWQPADAWGNAFAADATEEKSKVRITRAMSCVARQLGRFYLETYAPPPAALQAFMVAACGVAATQIGFQWINGEVPDGVTDDHLLAEWRHQIKRDLLAHVPAQATDAGFWFGRGHGRVVALMSYAMSNVRWKTLSLVPDANGDVTLEGELGEPTDQITGYANRGRFGVETCAIDPTVARPRFRAVCPIAKDDTTAWIQLLSAPPHRVLTTPFAQILVRRAADQPLVFDRTPYGEARVVTNADGFSQAILEQLNRVRAQAGFPQVRLSATESASATRLAGHYFAAALAPDGDGVQIDNIALGLLAGWQVGGMIRDGHFVSTSAPRTRDAGEWLSGALATPLGRVTLLDKNIDEVALGPLLLSKGGGLAAIVTGYRHYQGDDHSDDVARLYARLASGRKRLGLKAPVRLGGMAGVLRSELQRVQAGTVQPSAALQTALSQGVSRFSAGMRGYVVETTSLDGFEIPEDVVKRPSLYLEIAVAHHKPPGAAWAQLVILVIFADDPRIQEHSI